MFDIINKIVEFHIGVHKHLAVCIKELPSKEILCYRVSQEDDESGLAYKINMPDGSYSGYLIEFACPFRLNPKYIDRSVMTCSNTDVEKAKTLHDALPTIQEATKEAESLLRLMDITADKEQYKQRCKELRELLFKSECRDLRVELCQELKNANLDGVWELTQLKWLAEVSLRVDRLDKLESLLERNLTMFNTGSIYLGSDCVTLATECRHTGRDTFVEFSYPTVREILYNVYNEKMRGLSSEERVTPQVMRFDQLFQQLDAILIERNNVPCSFFYFIPDMPDFNDYFYFFRSGLQSFDYFDPTDKYKERMKKALAKLEAL